jgi:carboxypeptidase family protein
MSDKSGRVNMKKHLCHQVAVVLLLLYFSGTGRGQVTASVSGRVEDATGGVVPGAMVTVASLETGGTRTATTGAAGTYRVLSLPVGSYEVRAQAAGFKAVLQTGISLVVGEEAVVNLKLEVGAVQEQVTVTGEAPLVNTTTSSVSGLVGERQVKDLPLNGRSFDNLITLNPGAVNYSALKSGPSVGSGEGAYFTVAGRRPYDNLFLLNGIEYTGSSNIGITPGGVSGQLLGIDAVREFNVMSDAYGAEYGKRAGAQVSVVTQSGTNQLHGAAFEFLRNNKLDARNFFDQTNGAPPFKRNQFGGSLGGPIKKDKMFLFGNYEGFRHRLALSNVAFVPDNNARQGSLPCGVAYTTSATRAANCSDLSAPVQVPKLDRRMLNFMALWPRSNGPEVVTKDGLATGVANNFNSPLQKIREDFGTTRFDLNVSEKDTFTAAYTVDDGDNLSPLTNPFFGTIALLRGQVSSAQETHVFSPQLLNVVRAGFSRAAFNFDSPTIVPLPPDITLFAGKPPGPIVIGGASAAAVNSITSAGGGISGRLWNYRNLFTGSDDVQLVQGKHQLSFGAWFQRIQVNANSAARNYGEADFGSLLGFLQGITTNWVGVPNRTFMYWRSIEGAWYVQDVMQLRPNLTLRVGVRHEFTNGWNEKYGRASQYLSDANGNLTSDPLTSTTHIGGSLFTDNKATKLFSPRVGIAWDPFGNGKTSIRAGFGLYYTLLDNLSFQGNFTPPFNTPFAIQNTSLFDSILPPPVAPGKALPPFCSPAITKNCTTPTAQGTQVNPETPAVVSWNYSIEQQLTRNTSLRVAYVGSHGYHSIIDIDGNTIPLQTCTDSAGCMAGGVRSPGVLVPQGTQYFPLGKRPNPYLANAYRWYTEGISSYNALQADLTKRFSSGLLFRANYTFSKNLDDSSGVASSQSQNQNQSVMDPRHPLRDYGRSALDFRHQGSGSFNYELPLGNGKRLANGLTGVAGKLASGWQVNGIVTLLSGFPLTPLVGTNQSGNGNTFNPDRPNVNAKFQGPVIIGGVDQWFDPAAFSLPTLGTWGNLGRGVLDGPGLAELDFSVFKTTSITERTKLVFRAEVFNIANRANFNLPNPIIFSGSTISASAGKITSTTTNSRQIQFGLKLTF